MNRDEMDALTADTDNKSEKIRRLYSAGVTAADIGRYLEIRYQHVYNVLLRADLIQKNKAAEEADADPAVVLRVEGDGTVMFPVELLERHGLTPGSNLICRSGPDGLTIMSQEQAVDYLREVARSRMPREASLFEALLANLRSSGSRPPG